MTDLATRDRPAKNPGGMVCELCSNVFIGEEWHVFCAICIREVAKKIGQKRFSSGVESKGDGQS